MKKLLLLTVVSGLFSTVSLADIIRCETDVSYVQEYEQEDGNIGLTTSGLQQSGSVYSSAIPSLETRLRVPEVRNLKIVDFELQTQEGKEAHVSAPLLNSESDATLAFMNTKSPAQSLRARNYVRITTKKVLESTLISAYLYANGKIIANGQAMLSSRAGINDKAVIMTKAAAAAKYDSEEKASQRLPLGSPLSMMIQCSKAL